jgi:O-antigen/teichoic acid export membrane protein
MGIWAILQLILGTCSTFVTWFPQAVTKYVAENFSKGAKPVAAAVVYQALRSNVITYIPIIIGFYFGAPFLASHLLKDASYAPLFRILAFDVFLNAGLLQVLTAALLGLKMFRETAAIGLFIQGIVRQLLIISLLLVFKNLIGLTLGWLISDAMTVAIYLTFMIRVLGPPRFDFPLAKLIRFYLPLEIAQIVAYAQNWFDRAILAVFFPLAALGIYNAGVVAYGVLASVSVALGNMLFPALSSIQGRTRNQIRMNDAIRTATRYSALTLTPLGFLLLATAKPALTLFVGEAYIGGYLPLVIFSASYVLTVFATSFAPALMALNETAAVGAISGVTVLIGLGVAYALLPHWGTVGVAVGRASAFGLVAVLQAIFLRKKMNFQVDFYIIAKTLIAGGTMGALVTVIQFLDYSKFLLPLYILIGVISYLIMLRLLNTVEPADLDLLRIFLGRRLSFITVILSWILLAPDHRK